MKSLYLPSAIVGGALLVLGFLKDALILPSGNAVVELARVLSVVHHVLLGHTTFGSNICNPSRKIVEDCLDLANLMDFLATTLCASGVDGRRHTTRIVEEQEVFTVGEHVVVS